MDALVLDAEAARTVPGWRGRVEAHSVVAFLVLAFPFSWALVPVTGGAAINPAGPLLAALIVSALVGGRMEVGAWLRRSFTPRGPRRWYPIAIAIVVGLNVLAVLIALFLGVPSPSGEELSAWPEILVVFPLYLLLIGATEESGWRGFALPRLTESLGPMRATAVLGFVIAAWHLPLVLAGEQVAVILVAVAASQFLFTWLQARTGGSVPVVMVAHASQGGIAGAYVGPMFTGADERLELSILSGLLVLVAGAVIAASRRRAGDAPDAVA